MDEDFVMEAKSPKYNDSGTIDLEVNHPDYGWIPFTANPNDEEEHGRDLYARAVAGEFGPIAPAYVPTQEEIDEEAAAAARAKRDKLIAASDWSQLPDSPYKGDPDWVAYRQALRDISDQPGFPHEIDWPEAPE